MANLVSGNHHQRQQAIATISAAIAPGGSPEDGSAVQAAHSTSSVGDANEPISIEMGAEAASTYVPLARQLQPATLSGDDRSAVEPLRKAAVTAKRLLLAGDRRGAVEILRAIADSCLVNLRMYNLCDDPDHVHERLDCHLEALWAEAINDPEEADPAEIEYWEGDDDDPLSQEDARRLANEIDLPEWPLPTVARTPGSQVRVWAAAEEEYLASRRVLYMGTHARLGESSPLRKLPGHIVDHISSFLQPPATSWSRLLSRAEIDEIACWVEGWMHNQDTIFEFNGSSAGEWYARSRVHNHGLLRECETREDMCFGPPLTVKCLRRVALSRPSPSALSVRTSVVDSSPRLDLLAAVGCALAQFSTELHASKLAYFELQLSLPTAINLVEYEATLSACNGATRCSFPPNIRRFRFHTLDAMRVAFGQAAHATIYREETEPLDDCGGWVSGPCRYWVEELELEWVGSTDGTTELRVLAWPRFAWQDRQSQELWPDRPVRWVCGITLSARMLRQHAFDAVALLELTSAAAAGRTHPGSEASQSPPDGLAELVAPTRRCHLAGSLLQVHG